MGVVNRHVPPEEGATELRIHGVGGTTPTSLLEQTGVRQVTGDGEAGFYRGAISEPGRTVEAYSWGGLTARSWSRAFWVLLLPFSLVNLAGWMVEPRAGASPLRRTFGVRWHEALVLVIGMLTTVLFVVWTALITMNLLAFQCGAIPACRNGAWYVRFFDQPYFTDQPGRRIVAGALVPLGLLGLFLWLGRSTRSRYEGFAGSDRQRDRVSQRDADRTASVIADPQLWSASAWQAQAERLHVAATLLVLGGLLGRASAEFGRAYGGGVVPDIGYPLFAVSLLLAAAVVVALFVVAFRSQSWLGDQTSWLGPASTVVTVVAVAVMLTALALTWQLAAPDVVLVDPAATPAAGGEPVAAPDTDLWGFGWAPIVLLVLAVLGVVGFSLIQLVRWWTDRDLHLDQLSVVMMLALVVFWDLVWLVLLVGLAVGVVAVFRDRTNGDLRAALGRAVPFVLVLLVSAALAGLTAGAAHPWGPAWPRMTPLLAFTVLLGAMHVVAAHRADDPPSVRVLIVAVPAGIVLAGTAAAAITGREEWSYGLLGMAWVVLAVAWLARMPRRGWRWNGPAAVALLALSLLMGAFSGTAIWLVDILDGDGTEFRLSATAIYEWLTVGFAAFLLAGVLAAAVWFLLVRQGLGARETGTVRGPGETGTRAPAETLPETVRAADVVLTVVALLMLAGGLALFSYLVQTEDELANWVNVGVPVDWSGIASVASWISVGVALGAVLAVRRGLREQAFRTRLGMVWDVASFWPRVFHPFATPAYSARAIPELQARLTEIATGAHVDPTEVEPDELPDADADELPELEPGEPPVESSVPAEAADDGGSGHTAATATGAEAAATGTTSRPAIAILSGHSQGSVLSLAAVASLHDDVARHVLLVTHGSPLFRFYAQYFPRYFHEALFVACARKLGPTDDVRDGTWLNFWRRTDPICDPLFTTAHPQVELAPGLVAALDLAVSRAERLPDIEVRDPVDPVAPTRGHSGYMADPAMWRAIEALCDGPPR